MKDYQSWQHGEYPWPALLRAQAEKVPGGHYFPFRSDDIELLYPKQFARILNSI